MQSLYAAATLLFACASARAAVAPIHAVSATDIVGGYYDELNSQLSLGADAEQLHDQGRKIFDAGQNTHIAPVTVHNWAKPEQLGRPTDDDATLQNRAMERYASLVTKAPPVPDWARERAEAYSAASQVYGMGSMRVDQTVLQDNMAGAYLYERFKKTLGQILLQPKLLDFARRFGELFLLTIVHEADHAAKQLAGWLSPENEIVGEISAFTQEARMLLQIDLTGEKVAHAWTELKHMAGAPKFFVDYVGHLVQLRWSYLHGQLREMVEGLGYQDHPEHALH